MSLCTSRLKRLAAAAVMAVGFLALGISSASAEARVEASGEVDLALVLAVDISYSMDEDEQRLQRGGYMDGLRSSMVIEAIRRGAIGRIAVIYMEWAGSMTQQVIVPWQIIDGPESAEAFVAKLEEVPIRRAYRTSISGGIDYAVRLLEEAPVTATRKVIDVSGDGANNQGRSVTAARDEAIAKGITINGLPIMLKKAGYMDVTDLDVYYRDCVIGGRGSFLVPVRERVQFSEAIRNKLFLEVAENLPQEELLKRVQAGPIISCMAGERQWNDRMGN
jgi:hypothetical protein